MSDTSSNKGDYQNIETYGSLQKRIADLEAQNALLRAFWHKFHATKVKQTYYATRKLVYDLDEWNELLEVFNATEAAIDGGAMGEEPMM